MVIRKINKILILTNDSKLEKLPECIKNFSDNYSKFEVIIDFTVCHVVDLGIVHTDRLIYLEEANKNKNKLGERVKRPETLLEKEQEAYIQNGRKKLNEFITRLNEKNIQAKSVLLIGDPKEQILDYIKKNNITLIISGESPRSKLSQLIFPPLSKKVMKKISNKGIIF